MTVKCSRGGCKRKTEDPKADHWLYMDEAPDYVPHWVGWWCPECFKGLRKLMKAHGVEPETEKLQ